MIGFQVESGPCTIDAFGCTMSPGYPDTYGNKQTCVISATEGKLVVEDFRTEYGHDTLTINGNTYSGDSQALLEREEGGKPVLGNITWSTDETAVKYGWKLCLAH